MENKEKNEASVAGLVIKNVVSAIVAMIMVLVYNLADTFFIGQTHDAYQVAAVSLATPVFLLAMAFGTILGVGGTSMISRAMGEGRTDYAKKYPHFVCGAVLFWELYLPYAFGVFLILY